MATLTDYIRNLDVGETVMLDDERNPSGASKPTRLERAVSTAKHRAPGMAGRGYTTRRVQWIDVDCLRLALRITRTK